MNTIELLEKVDEIYNKLIKDNIVLEKNFSNSWLYYQQHIWFKTRWSYIQN